MLEQDGRYHHIQLTKEDVGRYVLLPGDPARTDLIAQYLDEPKLVAENREHRSWTGTLLGEKVTVTSTGMGCPSTAIAVEELICCGADTFIRIGTAGPLGKQAFDPNLIGGIVTGSVRGEGTTQQYVPIEYPAISNREVVAALAQGARDLNYQFAEGLSYTKDAFYSVVKPEEVPLNLEAQRTMDVLARANVLLTEMESAALLVLALLRNCRAAGVMAFADREDLAGGIQKTTEVAIAALKYLIKQDRDEKRIS